MDCKHKLEIIEEYIIEGGFLFLKSKSKVFILKCKNCGTIDRCYVGLSTNYSQIAKEKKE